MTSVRTGLLTALLITGTLLLTASALADPPPALSAHDQPIVRQAFDDADRGQWDQAETLAAGADDKLPLKILQWIDYLRPQVGHSFDQVGGFVDQNPDWPLLTTLRVRAEETAFDLPDTTLAPWFQRHAPVTPMAKLRLAQVLAASGKQADSDALVRQTWVEADFNPADETRVLAIFGPTLRSEDHVRRLDRLLFDGKAADARRMLPLVPPDWRLLADARIKVATSAKGADQAVAKVPASLAGDPGLAFARMRSLRHKDQDDAAAAIIEHQQVLGRPEAWWPDRQILARRLLQLNEPAQAYRIITEHQLHDPGSLAEAEFTAGWIALRFLKDPASGSQHFTRLYNQAKLPLTLARAAYWAGRSADVLGKSEDAIGWYEKAALYPTTYYGQLAGAMPGLAPAPKPVPEPQATPAERAAFEQKELVRVVRILLEIGQDDRAKAFLNRLADLAQTPADYAAAADFAEEIGRPDLGVTIAKKASYVGVSLLRAGYPVVWVPRNAGTEQALLLALMRQESAFDQRAVSPSGARGLMQLMPGTANQVAKSLGMPYAADRLTADAAYNVTLGQAYFDTLLATFNGSYVLSVAGYNAGPGRVQQWLGQFGDPRQPETDPVDWVESIPFTETRNYVQRVLENLQVYRLRIGDTSLAFSLEADLRR